ncbi:MAG: four helix bundle protein [Patescibacteria group bacterium]
MFRFLNWAVYISARNVCKSILSLAGKLPNEIRYSLGNQIIRSSTSILLNIAEGSGKSSDRELNRFFDISIGSVNETVANLDFLRDNNFITREQFEKTFAELVSISKQLGGFKKSLKR